MAKHSAKGAMTGAIQADAGYASGGSQTYGIQMPTKGGRNATTNQSRRGAGQVAPRPQASRQGLLASSSATASMQASMARVKSARSSPSRPNGASFTPPQNNAYADLKGQSVGQAEVNPRGPGISISPQTKTARVGNPVATRKPKRKGVGASFYGEY